MNKIEALRILGLDEEATLEDVKTAYKEMAQILHPDRFSSKKKLQDRATEQFKRLNEAYELLLGGKLGNNSQGRKSRPSNEFEARLAGIAAARTQLVAQRDLMLDERRNALIIGAIGAVIAILLRRIPIGIALGTTAIVWGIVKFVSAYSTIKTLDQHIKRLNEEQEEIAKEYGDL